MSIRHYCDFCNAGMDKFGIGGVIALVQKSDMTHVFVQAKYVGNKTVRLSIHVEKENDESLDVCKTCLIGMLESLDEEIHT